jgi:hypothetical protein
MKEERMGRRIPLSRASRRTTRIHAVAILIVLLNCCVLGEGWAQSQSPAEPYKFFKQFIQLSDEQIASIDHGKAVARVLPTPEPSEVVVFGAVYINASSENYLKAAQDLESLRALPSYLGIRQFSTPPNLSDLEGFVLEDEDINDLKRCRAGKCELQLPTESMEAFEKTVDWSAPDVAAQVNRLAQKRALEKLIRYQTSGNSALGTYYDKEHPLLVVDQFDSLVGESASMEQYLPDLKRYLIAYPQAQLPNSTSLFYWERVKFGLKPTLRINQMVIYRGSSSSSRIDSVAIKQLYASHYFQTALDLSVCVSNSKQPGDKGFYLITLKGSRQAGLTGPKGAIIRKAAVSRTRSSLEESLMHMKNILQNGQ